MTDEAYLLRWADHEPITPEGSDLRDLALLAKAETARADKAERLCEKYARRTIERSKRIAKLEAQLDAAHKGLAFFRCTIKSGEKWTETCDRIYTEARGEGESDD